MPIDLTSMKANMVSLIDQWGTSVKVERLTTALNAQGRRSGSFQSAATETMWIQPVRITDVPRGDVGVIIGTSHYAYQRSTGYAAQETDRVTRLAGDTAPFDVVGVEDFGTHRRLMLKQVKKS